MEDYYFIGAFKLSEDKIEIHGRGMAETHIKSICVRVSSYWIESVLFSSHVFRPIRSKLG